MKDSVGGTRQTERWKLTLELMNSLRRTGQYGKDQKRRDPSGAGQGWCEVAGVWTGWGEAPGGSMEQTGLRHQSN